MPWWMSARPPTRRQDDRDHPSVKSFRSLSALPIVMLLLALTPAPALAQDWLAVPFLGITFGGSSALFEDLERGAGETSTSIGGSVMWLGRGPLGVEGDFGYVPGFFERGDREITSTGSYVTSFTGSAVLTLPVSITRESLRPYVVAGLGVMHAEAKDIFGVFIIRSTMPALVIGGGAMGFLTTNVGVRFDLRHLRSLGQGEELVVTEGPRVRFWRGSIGLILRY
jgi:opacity protein-like surface antigen